MKAVRVGICCLLAFAILSFGAVEEWAQAVLEIGAALLLAFWAIRQYRTRAEPVVVSQELPPLLGFALVVIVQCVFHLTASRYETRMALQLLLLYLIVLFLMSQAYSRTSHWRGFLWFMMTLGFSVALFGILQHLTFNGKLYWFREIHSGVVPFGPYANRNHFAGFAELITPFALVPIVLGKVRRERLFLVALFVLVPIVALVLSASRGGIVSFSLEMVILFLLLLVRRVQTKHMLAGGTVVLAAILAVSWIGVQQVIERFKGISTFEVSAGKRTSMQRDTWHLFLDHPIFGTGLGTFQTVFPPYDSLYDGKIANHAHNDYLEALAETGLLGGLCCACFLAVLFLGSLKVWSEPGVAFGPVLNLAGLVACSGIIVHSLVDFNLHIPANALLYFVCAHVATVRLESGAPGRTEGHSGRGGLENTG